MVNIYRRKWERGLFSSLAAYLRDVIIYVLPIKRLSPSVRTRLYGIDAKFAFAVHPRVYQDVFISSPFLKPLKLFLRKQQVYRLALRLPSFALNTVRTKSNVDGFVIGQFTIPEIMFEHRHDAVKMLKRSLRLIAKITQPGTVVGLGGWLPMISKRGILIEDYARKLGLVVTNGHCGTLASIYMTVERVAQVTHLKTNDLTLAVLGVGKMGGNVAKAFNHKVKRLLLIDINEGSLLKLQKHLRETGTKTQIDIFPCARKGTAPIRDILKESHLGVCATSSFRNILKLHQIPPGYVAIDDSRPEAHPRDPKMERIILEGGLLKIENAAVDYDYGFGQDDNVFGCLGEAYVLALNQLKELKPTLGDVDLDNFFRFLRVCRQNKVREGDFKSSDVSVSLQDIRFAFELRGRLSQSTKSAKAL